MSKRRAATFGDGSRVDGPGARVGLAIARQPYAARGNEDRVRGRAPPARAAFYRFKCYSAAARLGVGSSGSPG